jgi:ribosomal-protein-alanine N-acetyltransferase
MIPDPTEPVRGDGLLLRPIDVSDADIIMEAGTTDVPDWTFIPRDLALEDARRWVHRSVEARRNGRAIRFVVETDLGRAGTIGAEQLYDHDPGVMETFYFILPAHRGGGLATRALMAIDNWLVESVAGLRRLQLHVIPGNPASERVAQRAGYRREGLVVNQIGPVNGYPTRDAVLFGKPVGGEHDGGTVKA